MTIVTTHAPGTFCWADLGTTDAAAAKRFYTGLFGWKYEDMPMGEGADYTMFERGGNWVAALYPQDTQQQSQGIPPHWLSYVAVDSADQAAERTRSLGGTVLMDPFDVFEVGRMAVIEDPTGAVVALWEARTHPGAGIVGEPNSLCWNELNTADPDRAAAFYTGLLGWQTEQQPMGDFVYTYFKQGERRNGGMMRITPDMGPIPPHWAVYFAVDDCDAKTALASQLGGKVLVPPSDVPDVGRFAILQDPQGAAFAIIRLG
jgi:predicted enzyme related to lactoylglutathione lyase